MTLTTLRRARLERGLTQLEVSLKAGIAPSRLSIVERGIVPPTGDELHRLNAVLALPGVPAPERNAADASEETQ